MEATASKGSPAAAWGAALWLGACLTGCSGGDLGGRIDPLQDVVFVPWEMAADGGFFLDLTEVTNDAFAKFLKATRYRGEEPGFLLHWRRGETGDLSPPVGLDSHPVVHVSLADAEAFARWKKMRLPTAAEWDVAAGYGVDGGYPFGLWQPLRANTLELGLEHTTPVGLFENGRSILGIYDLAGNVSELTIGDGGALPKGGSFKQFLRRVDAVEDVSAVARSFSAMDVGFRCASDATPLLMDRVVGAAIGGEAKIRAFVGFLQRSGAPGRRCLESLAASRSEARAWVNLAIQRAGR
jgi:sulfatase-modifying factor enzyme 1